MSKNTVTITDNRSGKTFELPILRGNLGADVIDIRMLNKGLGYFTFDPGFTSTASCASKITFIDGEKGILLYRGYPIEELAEKSHFLEVAYLMLYGDLPTEGEYKEFEYNITHHSMINESVKNFYNGFRADAHPMSIMVGVVGALSSFYHDSLDIYDINSREVSAHRLIAKIPTIAACCYKYYIGQPFMYPKNDLGYAENFLRMMFAVPSEPYEVNPVVADALDKIFILHADHEQNASTSTVRLAGSSQANPFACISSGITALWGPAHGGANEAVLKMLADIGSTRNIKKVIERTKNKKDSFRLMGFGHRIYKNYDPRAQILKKSCDEVLKQLNINDPMYEVAMRLEEIALGDDYFIEKKLYPNVDFYSGIIQKAIGIPVNMFTVIFALARTVGWIAQWKEMVEDQPIKIGRPSQLYNGEKTKSYIPISKRK